MEAIVTRPAISCCRAAAAPTRVLLRTPLPTTSARQKSTSARTRRALNIPPHPSFLNPSSKLTGRSSADAARATADQIIFNPPAAAPSVFHTPFKFLPTTDPRRRANLASSLLPPPTTTPSSTDTDTTTESFPVVSKAVAVPRHHLTMADIEQMRRLRAADPATHTVHALARHFACSKLFVLMCCQAPAEHKAKVDAAEAAVRARWGPVRRRAREDRGRRWGMVFDGEI